jgi:hypothetical protein
LARTSFMQIAALVKLYRAYMMVLNSTILIGYRSIQIDTRSSDCKAYPNQ